MHSMCISGGESGDLRLGFLDVGQQDGSYGLIFSHASRNHRSAGRTGLLLFS